MAYAARGGSADYFNSPQIGIWFGPDTPLSQTGRDVNTSLGGGIFFRQNLPYRPLKIGIDTSYQYFLSRGVNRLTLWPVYGSLIYRIPINFSLAFQLKAGAGGCYVGIRPDRDSQWDPIGILGFEGSFPAGKYVNIGFRVDYMFIYEGYIKGSKKNGHILNTGITLYFNLGDIW